LQIAYPLVRQSLEKISARIAVSEDARRTLVDHLGGDAVVIPNGVFVDAFHVEPDPRWTGTPEAPTVVFLGRLDEPRKGLPVLLEAVPALRRAVPGVRVLVVGRGETGPDDVRELLGEDAAAVEFVGGVSDEDKARLLASADVYVAPQTGGESFGIVLVEAMSAGTAVVASDLGAFRRVLDDGAAGVLFRTGDSADLARTLIELLADPERRAAVAEAGSRAVARYDWSSVAHEILTVYEMAVEGSEAPVGEDPTSRRGTRRLDLRRLRGEEDAR
jgi:phosphatidylinositol alpha-mannosyltransferase